MGGLTAHVDVPAGVRAPAGARRAVQAVLVGWGFDDPVWLYEAAVVVSELVTNAVCHGGGCLEVEVAAHDRDVTVSVADGSSVVPRPTGDIGSAESGRGLAIIEALTVRWAVEDYQGGKRIWALLPPCPFRSDGAA